MEGPYYIRCTVAQKAKSLNELSQQDLLPVYVHVFLLTQPCPSGFFHVIVPSPESMLPLSLLVFLLVISPRLLSREGFGAFCSFHLFSVQSVTFLCSEKEPPFGRKFL